MILRLAESSGTNLLIPLEVLGTGSSWTGSSFSFFSGSGFPSPFFLVISWLLTRLPGFLDLALDELRDFYFIRFLLGFITA